MPPTKVQPKTPVGPPKEEKQEVVTKYVRPVVCVACGGTGRSSNNSECVPCEGTGLKDGKRPVKVREVKAKPAPAGGNLFE
jgi:DnaJ-class molecular chaperone